jgi:hypothetical protein
MFFTAPSCPIASHGVWNGQEPVGLQVRAGWERLLLVEQLAGTLVTVAKDVKIQVDFNPNKVAGCFISIAAVFLYSVIDDLLKPKEKKH